MSAESLGPDNMCLHLPKGFYSLMEMFVKDLMRAKPEDVFEYGAAFFENLLQIRTATGHDPAIHGPMSEEGLKVPGIKTKQKHRKSKTKENITRKGETLKQNQDTFITEEERHQDDEDKHDDSGDMTKKKQQDNEQNHEELLEEQKKPDSREEKDDAEEGNVSKMAASSMPEEAKT